MQWITGFLSICLELEKCGSFATISRIQLDLSESTWKAEYNHLWQAALNVTKASRNDSISSGREHKAQQWISETGLGLLTCIVN